MVSIIILEILNWLDMALFYLDFLYFIRLGIP